MSGVKWPSFCSPHPRGCSRAKLVFDQWEIDAGTVVSHRLDQGLRGSRTGVLVVSRTSIQRPWVLQEYTVLLEKALLTP